jgi:hypothetical protein
MVDPAWAPLIAEDYPAWMSFTDGPNYNSICWYYLSKRVNLKDDLSAIGARAANILLA